MKTLKKILILLLMIAVILLIWVTFTNDNSDEIYVDLSEFLEVNKEELINRVATGSEEVTVEIGEEINKLIITIITDIELTDENRVLYSLAFESVQMEEMFLTLAKEIQNKTRRDYIILRVIFVDINGEEISNQIFSTLAQD